MACLGEGSYATVYLVKHKKYHQKLCAMKKIRKYRALDDDPKLEGVKMERAILARANHPYIMELYFTFQNETHFFFGMEFCNGGELFTLITTFNQIKNVEEKTRFYAAEILLALDYMHKAGVIMRDLKTENVMIGANGHARLTDFGVSEGSVPLSNSGIHSSKTKGTPEYMAPEMYDIDEKSGEATYGFSVDFWALGLVIYEMLSGGRHPFKKGPNMLVEARNAILHENIVMPKHFSPEAADLVSKLLDKN